MMSELSKCLSERETTKVKLAKNMKKKKKKDFFEKTFFIM